MLPIDLSGRVALVVGGSRGIGVGIVEALCRAGARVVFTHRGSPQRQATLANLLEQLRGADGQAEDVVADACDPAQTKRVIDDIVRLHGRLDILVCNVGQTLRRPVDQVIDDQWRHFLDINLSSAFYAVRAALPHMEMTGHGRIVLIGSSAVFDGGGGAIDYASAKAGLHGMMAYLNRNYARKGILTNLVHPCVIDTELFRERYDTEEKRAGLASTVPAGRLGTPADVAGLVAFLVCPLGDFVCGQAILVDGGRTLFR